MARELGMNPRNFGKLDNHRQERWKLPLGKFIEEWYLKRFGHLPEKVLSIENKVKMDAAKKVKKREAKLTAKTSAQ